MSTSVGSDVIFHFLSAVNLVDQPQCALEDDNLELFDEPEEVCVVGDSRTNAEMEVLHIVVRLEGVHVDGKALRTDFSDPETDHVALVENDEFAPSCWINESTNAPTDPVAFNWNFVGGQQAEGKVTPKDFLNALFVVVVIIRSKAST